MAIGHQYEKPGMNKRGSASNLKSTGPYEIKTANLAADLTAQTAKELMPLIKHNQSNKDYLDGIHHTNQGLEEIRLLAVNANAQEAGTRSGFFEKGLNDIIEARKGEVFSSARQIELERNLRISGAKVSTDIAKFESDALVAEQEAGLKSLSNTIYNGVIHAIQSGTVVDAARAYDATLNESELILKQQYLGAVTTGPNDPRVYGNSEEALAAFQETNNEALGQMFKWAVARASDDGKFIPFAQRLSQSPNLPDNMQEQVIKLQNIRRAFNKKLPYIYLASLSDSVKEAAAVGEGAVIKELGQFQAPSNVLSHVNNGGTVSELKAKAQDALEDYILTNPGATYDEASDAIDRMVTKDALPNHSIIELNNIKEGLRKSFGDATKTLIADTTAEFQDDVTHNELSTQWDNINGSALFDTDGNQLTARDAFIDSIEPVYSDLATKTDLASINKLDGINRWFEKRKIATSSAMDKAYTANTELKEDGNIFVSRYDGDNNNIYSWNAPQRQQFSNAIGRNMGSADLNEKVTGEEQFWKTFKQPGVILPIHRTNYKNELKAKTSNEEKLEIMQKYSEASPEKFQLMTVVESPESIEEIMESLLHVSRPHTAQQIANHTDAIGSKSAAGFFDFLKDAQLVSGKLPTGSMIFKYLSKEAKEDLITIQSNAFEHGTVIRGNIDTHIYGRSEDHVDFGKVRRRGQRDHEEAIIQLAIGRRFKDEPTLDGLQLLTWLKDPSTEEGSFLHEFEKAYRGTVGKDTTDVNVTQAGGSAHLSTDTHIPHTRLEIGEFVPATFMGKFKKYLQGEDNFTNGIAAHREKMKVHIRANNCFFLSGSEGGTLLSKALKGDVLPSEVQSYFIIPADTRESRDSAFHTVEDSEEKPSYFYTGCALLINGEIVEFASAAVNQGNQEIDSLLFKTEMMWNQGRRGFGVGNN
tara:strand:- start:451 stop:3231 length:2781 start_codon:yes stop_codon:yes gene_type:complete